jgi:hypothetical protein
MLAFVQSADFLGLPLLAHAALCPLLVAWAVLLARQRRARPWLRSARLGFALAWTAAIADAATVAAQRADPTAQAPVLALLWLAALLTASAFVVLRAREQGDGGGPAAEPPEPPWWPEFERRFRDHVRRGPRPPAPRRPVARV